MCLEFFLLQFLRQNAIRRLPLYTNKYGPAEILLETEQTFNTALFLEQDCIILGAVMQNLRVYYESAQNTHQCCYTKATLTHVT